MKPQTTTAVVPSRAKKRRSFLSRHPRLKWIVYTLYGLAFVPLLIATLPLYILPKRWVYTLGAVVARGCVAPAIRSKVARNLQHAYGARITPRRIVALTTKVACNVVWSAIDCYYLWVWWWTFRIDRTVVAVLCEEETRAALAAGTGVIVATAHYNCFEIMPVYFSRTLVRTGGVIARSFPSPFLNWLYRRARLLHDVPSFYDEIKGVIKALRLNGVVGILPDLHARKRLALPATFYGRPTLTFDIHVRVGGRLQCPIIPAFLQRHKRQPWRYTLVFYQPIHVPRDADEQTIRAITQRINDIFEYHVRRWPSGWIWFHNKWALW